MGSQLVKQVYKDYQPDQNLEPLPFNEESLQFDTLIDFLFERLFKAYNISKDIDWDATFTQSNIQKNQKNVDQQFMKNMLKHSIEENSITGFATSEHTIKMLQESCKLLFVILIYNLAYSIYFKVHTDKDTVDFTRLQQKKFLVLYGLFQRKFETKQTEETFFQFVDKFLQDQFQPHTQRTLVGLNTGLKFSLSLLKEVHKISPQILISSLTHLYDTLCGAPPGSLYGKDAYAFQQDAILTDARDFIGTLVNAKESSDELKDISMKIVLRLGIVRSNPEDFLITISLLNKNPSLATKIDLRREIRDLPAVSATQELEQNESRASSSLLLSKVNGILKSPFIMFKAPGIEHTISMDNSLCSWTSDGQFLYYIGSSNLQKISIPKVPHETLYLFDESDGSFGEGASICYLEGRLLVRDPSKSDTPIRVFNQETLQEDTAATEAIHISKEDEGINMQFKEAIDKITGRKLNCSPLFTDGDNIYLVSEKRYIKPADADEDHQSLPTALVVEQYSGKDFKYIKSVQLYKNDQLDIFAKSKLQPESEDYFKNFALKSTWHTNGQNLLICHEQKWYLFDLKTGVRILTKKGEDLSPIVIHDYPNDRFFMIDKGVEEIQSLQDFKLTQALKINKISGNSSQANHQSPVVQMKAQYLESSTQKPIQNLFQRLMCEPANSQQKFETNPLPKNSQNLVIAVLLDHIKVNCEDFNVNFQKVESNQVQNNPKIHYIDFFRWQNSTCLTSTFFKLLCELLLTYSRLIDEDKTQNNVSEQISYLNVLHILGSNFKALSFCGIQLPEIMQPESYQNFLKTYNAAIVRLIEQGYKKSFLGDISSVCEEIWTQIYIQCQNIMTYSMQLIYSDTPEIISNLANVLSQTEISEKKLENCAFSLQYLSTVPNVTKLLKQADQDQRQKLIGVLQALTSIQQKVQIEFISKHKVQEALPKLQESSIFSSACEQFQTSFFRQLLVHAETQNQQLQSKKVQKNEEAKLKRQDEENQFKSSLKLISDVYQMITTRLQEQVKVITNQLQQTILEIAKDSINEDFAKHYKLFSKRMINLIFQELIKLNLYVTALPTLCAEQTNICSSISINSIKLCTALTNLTILIKQNQKTLKGINAEGDESDKEEEKIEDVLYKVLDQFTRSLCWLIGYVSFGLIQVKSSEPTLEESKKETPTQKMERMLMDSKLLSGGLESRYMHTFSAETKQKVLEILEISQDRGLSELVNITKETETEEDTLFNEVLYEGKNQHVDLLISVLQLVFEKQIPTVNYAKLGGIDGMRLTRAAFAVMIKYSSLQTQLENMAQEIDILDGQLDPNMEKNERLLELRKQLKDEDDFKDLMKQWNHASRMRIWIVEKKKNLSEKTEKKCRDDYMKQLTENSKKNKKVQKEEKKDVAEKTEEDQNLKEIQIDTTQKVEEGAEIRETLDENPEDEEKKPDDEDQEIKLTAEDQEKLKALIDTEFDKNLAQIFDKIIEKADFLLKMQVPTAYLHLVQDNSLSLMISAPSYIAEEQELINKLDWKDRLKNWKTMLQNQGSIKSDLKLRNEIFESGSMSVLACLQSPINVKKIQKRVESEFLKASRRVAGLVLLSQVFSLPISDGISLDLQNWFVTGLRDQTNKLTHYLANIKGCGIHLEMQVRSNFFSILKSILLKIQQSSSKQNIIRLLDALQWQFWGRDHIALTELQIFKTLRVGDGSRKHPIKYAWGKAFNTEQKSHEEEPTDLTYAILQTFENLYLNLVARIVDEDLGTAMQLKKSGTAIPALERSKSVILQSNTELLFGQAFDILFRELDRFSKVAQKFSGVDYFSFSRQFNKQKVFASLSKDCEDLSKKFVDEILCDLKEEEEEYEKSKEDRKKEKEANTDEVKVSDQSIEDNKLLAEIDQLEDESKESGIEPKTEDTTGVPEEVQTAEAKSAEVEDIVVQIDVNQGDEDLQDVETKKAEEKAELEKKAAEELATKLTESNEYIKNQTQNLIEAQFKAIYTIYNGTYLTRLLRLIEIFTSVAQTQAHPMSMVQRVANPFVLFTLIHLFLRAQPRNQILILKIVQNLISIGIPTEIFETTMVMLKKQSIYNSPAPMSIKFQSSFVDFWFNSLHDIRSAIFSSKKVLSDDSYEVSQEIVKLIQSIQKLNQNQYEEWQNDIRLTTEQSLLKIQELTSSERDVIFSVQIGTDFNRISFGSQVITASNQLLTVIGYAEKDGEGPLVIHSNYKSEKQELIGLYYDQESKERQEIIRVMPYNLKSVCSLNQQESETLANNSVLLQPNILKHIVNLLVQPNTKDDIRVQILKSLTNMFQILNKQFLQLLQNTNMLHPIIKYLLDTSMIQQKQSNSIIPITWLEAKATNIRVAALENDVSLQEQNNITAQIVSNKQILVKQSNIQKNIQIAKSAYLTSAINLHLLQDGQQYQCNITTGDQVNQFQDKSVRQGFIFVESDILKSLSEAVLSIMQNSFAVITHSVNVKELYFEIISKARQLAEDDKKKDQDWARILNCAVLVVSLDDYEDLKTDSNLEEYHEESQSQTELDHLMDQVKNWGGFDTKAVMYHITQLEDKSIENIHKQLTDIVKKVVEETKVNQETITRLTQDKAIDQLKAEQVRQSQIQSTREMKTKEILELDPQFKQTQMQSIVEKLLENRQKLELSTECQIYNLLDQEREQMKAIDKTITEEFVESKEPGAERSAKSEEAMCKLYLKEIYDFKLLDIASEYKKTLSQLLSSYCKDTLLQLMTNCDLDILMDIVISSESSSKQLACFFKSSFNQAWLTQSSTGQKTEIKVVKSLIRRIISFALKSEKKEILQFVDQFFVEDVIQAGLNTMKALEKEKPKSVAQYFASEQVALEQLHPNFLIQTISVLLECRYVKLLESKSYLPALFGLATAMFVRFWTTGEAINQMRLLQSCLQLVFFVQEYLNKFLENGVVEKIINTSLLTYIIKKIDYTQESYQEQQKLLLEVYLSIITLKQMAEDKLGHKIDSIIEMTLGISRAKRALKIVKEKQSFQFLKYYIHEKQLKDHDRQQMNQVFGTNNPHFDVKIKAKYSVEEVERVSIKANDSCELKPFTYLGISQKSDGKDMKYYSKEELKANNGITDFNFSHFYVFYPLKKQLLVGMGEQKHSRMGQLQAGDVPKQIELDFVPISVATSKNSSILLSQKGEIFSSGEKWGANHDKFTLITLPKNEVPKKVFCGPRQRFFIAESGKTFFAGESTEFELPNNTTTAQFKEFKLSNDEANKELVVDISCGNRYNLYVTDKGRIWASGRQFLKRVGMDSEAAVPLHLPIENGALVKRVWASSIKDQQLALIEVQLESGMRQLYSVGKNEQGLLGQGGKVKETKSFVKLDFDFTKTQFRDISLYADHAVAIDQNGSLWSWGSNLQQRSGLSEDIDCVFQPTKNAAFEQLGLEALKISCGKDHTLVLAKDKQSGLARLYSIGKEESNFKTLGTTQQQAGETVIRLISHLSDCDIIDFSACSKFNLVIIAGDKDPSDNLYQHKLPNGNSCQGVIHAYQKEGKWHFMTHEEYQQNNSKNLPDISLAFKCPIENMEQVFNGPNSIFDFDLNSLVDQNSKSDFSEFFSTHSEQPIVGQVRYFAEPIINGDVVHVNLSDDEYNHHTTQFDVNPLIFFRFTKQLKAEAKVPQIDLKKIYKLSSKFGFSFEVTPDLSFIQNKKLISFTNTQFNEYVELSKKFPEGGDQELVYQMSRFLDAKGSFDILKDKPEEVFKINEMTFKADGKLGKVPESIIKQRIELYWYFNNSFVFSFPYLLKNPPKGFRGQKIANTSAANLFQEVKAMVLTSVKMKFVDSAISNLPTQSRFDLEINRNNALRFSESGKVDHTGEHTVFGQIFQRLKLTPDKFNCFKQNDIDSQALHVDFEGESSIDAGGPYRETLTNIAMEIESGVLPLMIKTPNNRNNHGDNRDCFVVNQNSKTPTHEELFKFFGVIIAYAFRSKSCMPFNFAPVFWKQLTGEQLTESDLKSIDTYSWQIIQDLRKHAKTIKSESEFESIVDQAFTTSLNCSQEVELCESGRTKMVNQSNIDEFIKLLLQVRFNEGEQQMKWIAEGMEIIIPKTIVNILSWEEVEIRAAGNKTTDVEKLKSITEYRNCTEQSKVVKMFWNVMSRMSEEDKTLYLKFVWGRQRLPSDCSNLRYNHRIALIEYWDKEALPESHTCFFAVDLPDYESEEILEKKLLISIRFCGEIDND